MFNRVTSPRALAGAAVLVVVVSLGGCPAEMQTGQAIVAGTYAGDVQSVTTSTSGARTETTFAQTITWDGSQLSYDGTPLTEGRNFVSPGPGGDFNWTVRTVTITGGTVRVESDFASTADVNGSVVTYSGNDVTTVTRVDATTVTFTQERTLTGTLASGTTSTVQQTATGDLQL